MRTPSKVTRAASHGDMSPQSVTSVTQTGNMKKHKKGREGNMKGEGNCKEQKMFPRCMMLQHDLGKGKVSAVVAKGGGERGKESGVVGKRKTATSGGMLGTLAKRYGLLKRQSVKSAMTASSVTTARTCRTSREKRHLQDNIAQDKVQQGKIPQDKVTTDNVSQGKTSLDTGLSSQCGRWTVCALEAGSVSGAVYHGFRWSGKANTNLKHGPLGQLDTPVSTTGVVTDTRTDTDVTTSHKAETVQCDNVVQHCDTVRHDDTIRQADTVRHGDMVRLADKVRQGDTLRHGNMVQYGDTTVQRGDMVQRAKHSDTVECDDMVECDNTVQLFEYCRERGPTAQGEICLIVFTLFISRIKNKHYYNNHRCFRYFKPCLLWADICSDL